MKEKLKKFLAWLLVVAAVMGVYTLSFQQEYNQYSITRSYQGVVVEVYPEDDRVVVEEAKNPRRQSVSTADAAQFQAGDAVTVKLLERMDKRHTGLKDEKN